jgi:hypothetical protein
LFDGVARLDLEGDGLASQSLNEDLHVVALVGKGGTNERTRKEKREPLRKGIFGGRKKNRRIRKQQKTDQS